MDLSIDNFIIRINIPSKHRTNYQNKIYSLYGLKEKSTEPDVTAKIEKGDPNFKKRYNLKKTKDALYSHDQYGFRIVAETFSLYANKPEKKLTIHDHNNTVNSVDSALIASVRLYTSLLCIEHGGLPAHGSCVYIKGKGAYIFSGKSGAGKTTIARMLKRFGNVFNDEFNLLTTVNNTFHVFSNPFTSIQNMNFCSTGSSPLKKIFFLNKSDKNYSKAISHKEKVFNILKNTYTFPLSDAYWDKLLETANKIVHEIPSEMLYFSLGENSADEVYNIVTKE